MNLTPSQPPTASQRMATSRLSMAERHELLMQAIEQEHQQPQDPDSQDEVDPPNEEEENPPIPQVAIPTSICGQTTYGASHTKIDLREK